MHRHRLYDAMVTALLLSSIGGCSKATAPSNTVFKAHMTGSQEAPTAVTTAATGEATFTVNGANIDYTVTVSGLSGPASASHIHIGATGVSGPVRLNLCGTAGIAACSAATTGTLVQGTATAANISGGITMDSLLIAMRNIGSYANVHTAANPGGEIRGQNVPQ